MSKQGSRFYIKSFKTGRLYLVECMGRPRTGFGDSLYKFCDGSIAEKDSMIESDKFKNIGYCRNPIDYIDKLEE